MSGSHNLADLERTTPSPRMSAFARGMVDYAKEALRFYRIHLLLFVIVPLLGALVFWASNGEFKIPFIDALFVCVSAATGTGLSPVDLSSTTPWQQAIIVLLEICGNLVFVSWVVVYFRRAYFLDHLKHIVAADRERSMTRHETTASHASHASPSRAIVDALVGHGLDDLQEQRHRIQSCRKESNPGQAEATRSLRPEMVRRLDVAPHLVDPAGKIVYASGVHPSSSQTSPHLVERDRFPRAHSIESRVHTRNDARGTQHGGTEDFGGFPYPWRIVSNAIRRLFPRLHQKLRRTVTMPRTSTLVPPNTGSAAVLSGEDTRQVPYITFSANVGRNSTFHGLTDENIEELGGVEYRALTALLWIVPLYYFGLLAITFIAIAPVANEDSYRWIFRVPQQHRDINPIWFSAFQVIGAWANTGMSLVDQNMVPFRNAYLMVVVLCLDVLAGNTAFPIFLRFMIWTITKILPHNSRTNEALHFLLDHPRRCFIYLFPANQTWVLLAVQFMIDFVLWLFDIVLNWGNPATDSIPLGTRIVDALLQASAVRSAGFQVIPLSSLVPAVLVLDVVMMYIAMYPIALSVRSTNVYEETSLGVYEADEMAYGMDDSSEARVQIWGKYLWTHARRQLSFDMWWLALSLFLLCIIERTPLMDTSKASWFNIFALIFELVSAYGTVGLSLGVPYANFSFCGALHTLSKLILCAVMVRGRHRGLPVALDRAVILPRDLKKPATNQEGAQDSPSTEDSSFEKHERKAESVLINEKEAVSEEQSHSVTSLSIRRSRTLSFAVDATRGTARTVNVGGINGVAEEESQPIHGIEELPLY
ncbi:TrkH-domain-containing protein [Rhodofomes roseus]|uniref:Potassium transport protein n=1 Tax=Rhodofomes roseus TaxID=34475 RepID=A0ABQ8K397_9APHY|nr:TrkH-domain-containing protein [Rhodofomes roseus]KAH9831322.1 TrkH-domain-containing protein [Rhodofomes roseus]